jgi:hypothetical protein
MDILSLLVGILSTCIAVYQAAIIKANKKRNTEIQFILAGINNAAIQKQISWANQISLLKKPNNEEDWFSVRTHINARDGFSEISQLVTALEGTIDIDSSAISKMYDRSIDVAKKNNELQSMSREDTPKNLKPEETVVDEQELQVIKSRQG